MHAGPLVVRTTGVGPAAAAQPATSALGQAGAAGNAIEVRGLTHQYASPEPGGQFTAISSVDLEVRRGELVAIIGPSGCGKTTLLNILAGLEKQTHGQVTVAGQPPKAGSPEAGYLFARDSLLPWRTALGNAELAMEMRGVPKPERQRRALQTLQDVGLGPFVKAYRAQLSQGMRQRVALARTLAAEPQILLMDEPFSALDVQTRFVVQDLFLSLWSRSGSTAVLITHDLAEAIALADRVILFTRAPGRIKATFEVALPRPRSIRSLQGDDQFHRIYEAIWRELQDEIEPR